MTDIHTTGPETGSVEAVDLTDTVQVPVVQQDAVEPPAVEAQLVEAQLVEAQLVEAPAVEAPPVEAPPVEREVVIRDADGYIIDPRLVETRAMDIVELAVEVTARPHADPDQVVRPPRPARPEYAEPAQPAQPAERPPVDIDLTLDPPLVTPGASGDPETAVDPDPAPETGAEAIELDPRLEQRRADVVTDKRRRRRRRLLGLLGVLVLGAAGAGAVYSPFLDVDTIQIIGTSELTTADLAADVGLHVGDPMVFVESSSIEAKLRRDPRFVRVVVARRFPSGVSIRVTDRRAIAVVMGPTRGVVVGEGGMIIAIARGDELLRHVEVAVDPPMTPGKRLSAPLSAAVDVLGSMSFDIAAQIQKMSITAEGELVFDLGEGRTVLFGTVEDADRKLLATKTMLGPQVDPSGLCQLDVRVPTAPTIRRNPDCDPPPPPPDPVVAAPPVVDPATGAPVVDPATDPGATATTTPAPTETTPTTSAPQD